MESESVSLRSWPLIEERDLHFFILRCSVVGSLWRPSRMGLTWESLRTYMGLASDASGLFTSPNPFLDAKLRNSELSISL